MDAVVSSGHTLTTHAAVTTLEKGGNAFDAILSAGFAACAGEIGFASLGGGGFLLGHDSTQKNDFLLDFFVNHPGLNPENLLRPFPKEITVNFPSTTQIFHIGIGSLGVHGTLKGFEKLYKDHCTLELSTLLAPTLKALENGVTLSPTLEYILELLEPVFSQTEYGKKYFIANKRTHFNPLLKTFLKKASFEVWNKILYQGPLVERYLSEAHGAITKEDLYSYETLERETLKTTYRDYEILTNSLPSIGGPTIISALEISEKIDFPSLSASDKMLARAKILQLLHQVDAPSGTTHINAIDSQGNIAALSLSNGTGSGYFFPETGIFMNNMMGEEDLHSDPRASRTPGTRISSMMSPLIIRKKGKLIASMGTGGSNRIKSALLQVIWNLLDEEMSLKDAVEAPRIHFCEKGSLQIEPLASEELEITLRKNYPNHRLWDYKNLYFGGVHIINGKSEGWGDSRRDGNYQVVL